MQQRFRLFPGRVGCALSVLNLERRTVKTSFFTVCPGKKAIERTLLCTGNCKCAFVLREVISLHWTSANFMFVRASCARALSTALTVLICQIASFCSCLLLQQTVDTASFTTPPLLPPHTASLQGLNFTVPLWFFSFFFFLLLFLLHFYLMVLRTSLKYNIVKGRPTCSSVSSRHWLASWTFFLRMVSWLTESSCSCLMASSCFCLELKKKIQTTSCQWHFN